MSMYVIHIIYIEIAIERRSKRSYKLQKSANELHKTAEYKIHIKKSILFYILKINQKIKSLNNNTALKQHNQC